MSVNRNRARLNKATCSKDYNNIWYRSEFPMHWEEYYYRRKNLYPSQWRMYRTWKYNRKTQWKTNDRL